MTPDQELVSKAAMGTMEAVIELTHAMNQLIGSQTALGIVVSSSGSLSDEQRDWASKAQERAREASESVQRALDAIRATLEIPETGSRDG
jgi:hypothetical protein